MFRVALCIALILPVAALSLPDTASARSDPRSEQPGSGLSTVPVTFDLKNEINTKCGGAPLGMVAIDGTKASKDEMEEGKLQVTRFMAEADTYQECIIKASAAVLEKLSARDKVAIVKIIDEIQQEKEAVGKAFNDAVDVYNARP